MVDIYGEDLSGSDGSELSDIEIFHIHISRIRNELEQLSAYTLEKRQTDDHIIVLLNRQIELLESLDHAHYYKVSEESKYLARILILLAIAFVTSLGLWIIK